MSELAASKINKINATLEDVKRTRPEPHQEFCAYTYLLLPKPQNNVFGIIKVLATGSSYEDVERIITRMFNDGRLDDSVPFITICPTGVYKYIHPGGDPHNAKDVYNKELKEVVMSERDKVTEQKRQQREEVEQRARELQEDARKQEERNPDSYEVYSSHRVREVSIKSWIRAQENEIKNQKKKLLEATKKRQQLDRTNPQLKVRFEKELKAVVQQEAELQSQQAETVGSAPDDDNLQSPVPEENVVEGKGKEEL